MKRGNLFMDIACNIGFTDGTHLALDGFDRIFFYTEIPNYELEYTAYSLQKDPLNYYGALNALVDYNFIGIKRNDNADEIEFAGKEYAFKNYHNGGKNIIEKNDILYLQTSSITTIAVYEQWNKESKSEDERW